MSFECDTRIEMPMEVDQVEELIQNETVVEDLNPDDEMALGPKVAVVDAMAVVKICLHLGEKFVQSISNKYKGYDEVHIVFDRYDIQNSLKTGTCTKRSGGHDAIAYRITDSTIILQLSMKRLLAHVSTKDQLSEFLAKKLIHHATTNATTLFVTWRNHKKMKQRFVFMLQMLQPEIHVVWTCIHQTQMYYYWPYTDLRTYHSVCDSLVAIRKKLL